MTELYGLFGVVGFIISLIVLVKFFNIAADVRAIKNNMAGHYQYISLGSIQTVEFKNIPNEGIFITKNPVSDYYNIFQKNFSRWKILKTIPKYEEAKEFAITKAKELVDNKK